MCGGGGGCLLGVSSWDLTFGAAEIGHLWDISAVVIKDFLAACKRVGCHLPWYVSLLFCFSICLLELLTKLIIHLFTKVFIVPQSKKNQLPGHLISALTLGKTQ